MEVHSSCLEEPARAVGASPRTAGAVAKDCDAAPERAPKCPRVLARLRARVHAMRVYMRGGHVRR